MSENVESRFVKRRRRKAVSVKKQTVDFKFLTAPDNKALPYFQVVLLICVVMLTIPSLFINSSAGLDPSWYIGLHKAANEGLIFGRDIVFTYGPLGFLTVPTFVSRNLWVCSALYILLMYVLTVFGCSLYLRKMKANLIKTVIFVVVFTVALRFLHSGFDFELILCTLIFSYLYTLRKRAVFLLLGLAFLYGIQPFIKFSSVLAVGVIGLVFLYVLIRDKRGKEAAVFLIACLVAFVTVGLLLFRTPQAILTYLYGCLQIASGYNDAMGFDDKKKELLFAVFMWVLYIGLLCHCAFKKRRCHLIYLAFGFGPLFQSFKLGFVRHDEAHVVLFLSMWLMIFGLYYLKSFADAKIVGYLVLLAIFAMLYQHDSRTSSFRNPNIYNSVVNKLDNLRLSLNLLRGVGEEEKTAAVKTALRQGYPLRAETVEMLSGHTMDVLPWDIAITEAYGFKWHPRPVFQSYSAYTEYLDSLNAKYFSLDSRPEYILYALYVFDKRYAIFDEPATFRMLLRKYEPCAQDGDFIVLRKSPFADTSTEEHISAGVGKFRQIIPLPKLGDGLLFAKIHVEHNLLGLVRKFLFKSPDVYIAFISNDKDINGRVWRFVFSNAANGLFISKYVANQSDLLEIWKGDIQQDISGIALLTEHPIFFKDKITVEFFKMPTRK